MDENIANMLDQPTQPENIVRLMNDIRGWLRYSRRQMKRYYAGWDSNMKTFKTIRYGDEMDINARKNAEPEKMVVPLTYTQVMTYVTFAFMLMKQNETFFQLNANQNEAYGLTECSEDFLERDLRYNKWDSMLVQSLLDVARFGICALKTTWKKETTLVNVQSPGTSVDSGSGWAVNTGPIILPKVCIKYEGNQITNVSPYRLLPDLRMPLTRWREGRFVADEMEFNIQYLLELDDQDILAGVKYVDPTPKNIFREGADNNWDEGRFSGIRDFFSTDNNAATPADRRDRDFLCISSEGQFKLVPSKYGIGPENYPCDFLVQMINDQRIVRIERMDYMHRDFIYDIGQFIPDVHSRLNMALVDPINAIQEVVSFLVNTRVISLRQGIEKHVVYDPSVIETAHLNARSPYIAMKKGAPRNGVSNYLMQLKYVDPTMANMQEADQFSKILQTVTGVNENAMGQYSPGRRSATENRAANQGAASRMTFHTSLLWSDCYGPMGGKMLTNLRQGVSQETFLKVIGQLSPTPGIDIQSLFGQFCPMDQSELIGNNQFFVFNGTTQSERTYLSQSLQELVIALVGNPEMIPLLGYDVTKLIDEIQFLRGVRNVARFKLPPGGVNGQPPGTPPIPGVGTGVPGAGSVPQNAPVPALPAGIPGQPQGGNG